MSKINYKVDEISELEYKVDDLKHRYAIESANILKLRNYYRLEENDIKKLKGFSLKNLLLKIASSYHKCLDNEEKEAYMAKAKYDNALFNLEMLEAEIVNSEYELANLRNEEAEFKEAYAKTYHDLIKDNEIAKEKALALKEVRKDIDSLEAATKLNSRIKRKVNRLIDETSTSDLSNIINVFVSSSIINESSATKLDKLSTDINKLSNDLHDLAFSLTCINNDPSIDLNLDNSLEYLDIFLEYVFYGIDARADLNDLCERFKALKEHLDCLTKAFRKTINKRLKEHNYLKEDLDNYIRECINI